MRDDAERVNSDIVCILPFSFSPLAALLYFLFLLRFFLVLLMARREARGADLSRSSDRVRRNALNEKRRMGVAKEGRV